MKTLTGSEKQIKWAEDIRVNVLDMFGREYGGTPPEHIKRLIEVLKSETSAKNWIDMRCDDVTEISERYNFEGDAIEARISRIKTELEANLVYTAEERAQIIDKICTDGLADRPDYLSCIINFACRKLEIKEKHHTRRELPAWNQRRAELAAERGFAITDYKNQR